MEQNEDIDIEQELIDINDKIADLRTIKEQTPEQKAELAELIDKRKNRTQKRIDTYAGRAKAAEERARKAEEEVARLRTDFSAAEKRLPVERKSLAKVTFDGEEFYTDASLRSMVEAGDMTEQEAWDHQEGRRVAAAADRLTKKNEKQTFESKRNQTIQEVLKEYPQLNPTHPKYSLDDPFTKEVDRLLRNGYQFQPDGLKNAVEDAKRLLRMSDRRPDISDDLGVTRDNGAGGENTRRLGEKKVELTEWEQDNAVRMWVNTGMTNPKTGKIYTKAEAIEKALLAKKNRMAEMSTR